MGVVIETEVFESLERARVIADFARRIWFGELCIYLKPEYELKADIHRTNTVERQARRSMFVWTVLSKVVVLSIASIFAEIHAKIVAALSQNGTTISPHDSWIPAAIVSYDYDRSTTSLAEFTRLPNLRIIEYPNSS
jgi:predicted nucleic acid-binding protein